MLHVPTVQQYVGGKTAEALSEKLGTEVRIGRVNLGFFNRAIIDGIQMKDQQGETMLQAARLSAKFDLLSLSQGRIVITSAQVFGLRAAFYQTTPEDDFNFQFALDSLASKDTTSHTPLDLKINSLIIRHGDVKFDKRYVAPVADHFSPDHIHATNISAHAILNALQDDSLNINLKRFAMNERSGLHIKNLRLKAIANRQQAVVNELELEMPHSQLSIGPITANYQLDEKSRKLSSLNFKGTVNESTVTLSELTPFLRQLENKHIPVRIASQFSGTDKSLSIRKLSISSDNDLLNLSADGQIDFQRPQWNTNIRQLLVGRNGMNLLAEILPKNINIPQEVQRLGNVGFIGSFSGTNKDLTTQGMLTTEAGQAKIAAEKRGSNLSAHIETDGIDLQQILDNHQFGLLATNININGRIDSHHPDLKAQGSISQFVYKGYPYQNITLDGTYHNDVFDGTLDIDDKNVQLTISGTATASLLSPKADITAQVRHLAPTALRLSDQWPATDFSFDLQANIVGRDINSANGYIDMSNFHMQSPEKDYFLNNLHVESGSEGNEHVTTLTGDFGELEVRGQYDYSTLPQSITNLIASKLPTLPGISRKFTGNHNNFSIRAHMDDAQWLHEIFNIPLVLHAPMSITGNMNDKGQILNLDATLPHFSYDDNTYRDAVISISTPLDTLRTSASIKRIADNGNPLLLSLNADAVNNHLAAALHFENQSEHYMVGTLNADAHFFQTAEGTDAAHVDIHSSEVVVGDSIWQIEPGTIVYSKNDLTVDHLALKHDRQHLIIDGRATRSSADSLIAELKDIDVKYILDLVDFHSVDFSGMATGKAFVTNVFDKPEAAAHIMVNKFKFQDGRMGTLTADARLNNIDNQIDIYAVANDNLWEATGPDRLALGSGLSYTTVNGYVSPQRGDIELFIGAHNSRGEFLQSFCSSFMRDVNLRVSGDLRLYGLLSHINLTGEAVANGTLGISPLNTTYTLRNDTIRLVPNQIIFERDTVYDAFEHIAILSGALHHQYLTNLSYDLNVDAQNLLAYDFHDFGDDTFCGTVYGTGNCHIKGQSGEVVIDVDMSPDENSEIRYNAASPDAISNGEFIVWRDRDHEEEASDSLSPSPHLSAPILSESSSDIRLNLLINATPKATLKVIMDQQTGDHIALNGNGVIRATYYNKGSFDMFGNYNVDHGIYKLTIQNVIKKDFQFQPGSTIAFGGNPYNAVLNLKAQYTVTGVPLSDLQLGRSFTSNNIRVNCIMNIGGTPAQPRVDFALDMPTIAADAKQMIFSLINSEEEMNQQVLYLLAIGRFYNQGANNASPDGPAQQSQTSLAMQSLLSGTISQQLNNVLSAVVNNQNWNLGASITTGDQGFYNAEYEGLLSGRLLNNRLLINGQFGYRDNPNATSSFIGDFDLRYLLRPNGNLAIKVYNQTNDRYFTRNSLTTQGIGLIMKKDFSTLSDLFGIKHKQTFGKTSKSTNTTDSTTTEVNGI